MSGRLLVDLAALTANYQSYCALSPGLTGAVVKADAYGLGAARVASALNVAGCNDFFVATAEEGQSIEDVYEDAIWAFDVRGLSQGVMNILAVALRESGASEDELHMLRFRWENNLDPDTPVRQMQLPFTPNSSEGRQVRAALQNVKELRKELGWNRLSKLPRDRSMASGSAQD